MKISEALKLAQKMLRTVAQRPLLEAELLLAHYLQKERIYLHAHPDEEVDEGFFSLIQRRATHEPLEYIIKEVSFYSKRFFIEPGVLIPRPETELLIDEIAKRIQGEERVAEIGVGSGIISAILKMKFPNLKIVATDINKKALVVAQKNFERYSVDIKLVHTSLLDGVEEEFDIIISNPPYIKRGFPLEKPLYFEPAEALFGGERGDELLRQIIDIFIKSSAKILACEMGYDQKEAISSYLEQKGFQGSCEFYKDLAKLDRGFVLQKEEE
ncbi:release factor glutamine methyltransferase [Nitratiruptor sp. YY08-26]|uniref:peptide chain release factor N(5)-glutamine methyltransferase n=1 Tax=unclassified Nitratiruptor TaxID=2624044 RepID=UPI0019166C5F|nr:MULTISPECIES: peptide chain release factor N(5)-glutamine methyltransferase [unclassified Nitratiruptor]BCD62408.1 release factor glutamine methyltransferase [Nitratiruptor sp. YY08-13]BCD66344.1 release factor glutamine methyltransferase [Nitratiruptor sp. YY08-26]